MKQKVLPVLLALFALCSVRSVMADELISKVTVTGSISIETGSNGKTTVKAINVANVINLIDPADAANVSQLRFYWDKTSQNVVVAAKGATTSTVPVATLCGPGANGVSWSPTAKSMIGAGELAAMNGALAGMYKETDVITSKARISTIKIAAFGTLNGNNAILTGSIVITR